MTNRELIALLSKLPGHYTAVVEREKEDTLIDDFNNDIYFIADVVVQTGVGDIGPLVTILI